MMMSDDDDDDEADDDDDDDDDEDDHRSHVFSIFQYFSEYDDDLLKNSVGFRCSLVFDTPR